MKRTISRREIPLKREEVHRWLVERGKMDAPPDLKTFLEDKLGKRSKLVVDMGDEGKMPLADVIMDELEDYV